MLKWVSCWVHRAQKNGDLISKWCPPSQLKTDCWERRQANIKLSELQREPFPTDPADCFSEKAVLVSD